MQDVSHLSLRPRPTACPPNRGLLQVNEAGPTFTEEETAVTLRGTTAEELPNGTVEKLKPHRVFDPLDVLSRNHEASRQRGVPDRMSESSR